LPSARVKNGREHVVPLCAPALAILKARPRMNGRDFVFGAGEGGFSGWAKAKEALDESIPALNGWTVHDLRRTSATRMAEIGVAPHIVEAVLNHASGHKAGVAGIYNKATYEPEKRKALALWAKHIMKTVERGRKRRLDGGA
jgi:integrase